MNDPSELHLIRKWRVLYGFQASASFDLFVVIESDTQDLWGMRPWSLLLSRACVCVCVCVCARARARVCESGREREGERGRERERVFKQEAYRKRTLVSQLSVCLQAWGTREFSDARRRASHVLSEGTTFLLKPLWPASPTEGCEVPFAFPVGFPRAPSQGRLLPHKIWVKERHPAAASHDRILTIFGCWRGWYPRSSRPTRARGI